MPNKVLKEVVQQTFIIKVLNECSKKNFFCHIVNVSKFLNLGTIRSIMQSLYFCAKALKKKKKKESS